jgi:hypothetical protein
LSSKGHNGFARNGPGAGVGARISAEPTLRPINREGLVPAPVRARLEKLLAEARAAQAMPSEPSQLSLYRLIFPQMMWLADDEAAQFRMAFDQELKRLEGA